uniref:Uncharacterized protein n=1 Tax=Micromonas pusilla TaxID=38833 RepID=A0A7R9TFI7_MICPS
MTTTSEDNASTASTSRFLAAALAAATIATTACLSAPAPSTANVGYANDCDPICHVLDDGAAKSKAQEEAFKREGPPMGDLMAQLQAQRKAEEAAAAKAAPKKDGTKF